MEWIKREAYSISDALTSVDWINKNYSERKDKVEQFNKLLIQEWIAGARNYSDKEFVDRLLNDPKIQSYSPDILSLDEIELMTGREREGLK